MIQQIRQTEQPRDRITRSLARSATAVVFTAPAFRIAIGGWALVVLMQPLAHVSSHL